MVMAFRVDTTGYLRVGLAASRRRESNRCGIRVQAGGRNRCFCHMQEHLKGLFGCGYVHLLLQHLFTADATVIIPQALESLLLLSIIIVLFCELHTVMLHILPL